MTSEEPARERALRRAAWTVAALPALALVAAERAYFGDLAGFPLDDAFIHLQFAENLAAGGALAFNPGEPVAGTTAPLWTALLALLALLPGSLAVWAKGAGVAAHLASLAAVDRLARRLDLAPALSATAVVLVGWTDWLVFAATSGMEIPLFVLLGTAGLARHVAERRAPERAPSAFLLFGLAALARPEALLLPLLAACDRAFVAAPDGAGWRVDRAGLRAAFVGLALAAAVVAPVAAVYLFLSGSVLPSTLAAKVGLAAAAGSAPAGVASLVNALLRSLTRVVELLFASQPVPLLCAAGGALELARRAGSARDAGLLLPLWTASMPLASALLARGGELQLGNFGRYFFPLFPCVVLLALVALAPFGERRAERSGAGRRRVALWAAAALFLLAVPAARTARAFPLALTARANVEQSDRAAARFLAARARADALVATCDIGLLKYALPNPILDLAGIAQPELLERVARARAEGRDWPDAVLGWIESHRPDYVVLYPRWLPHLEAEPARFPPLARFRIERNIAMAGDELVVYATPWTREEPKP